MNIVNLGVGIAMLLVALAPLAPLILLMAISSRLASVLKRLDEVINTLNNSQTTLIKINKHTTSGLQYICDCLSDPNA